ncbi:fatty acid desaturase [Sulfitobacter mediterraneus]|uniref:Fatty acid desaturase n=1 Tax=Sulfitobacter mediterraneus TaxID=83219 RepID=A0A061SSH6_9RHOB|nr:fatty acid desaturase [Sulfitobacter mediterraneus]KAJ02618.1 fatty acid desaturase [Sulfitobacter mediterraneus]MBM1310979.1 fatty acid desaturase [Sulfitobacter mediterraneus]MBM1314862.1 fatty acid desaturase [Sulfitobacter mediterraneus]MBM1323222.1 fatty acid desaturase [Sulfitobacter mediterraneus]MBM1327134.1 fatty acid desaturase [Sulfitobacter mediterraneus]
MSLNKNSTGQAPEIRASRDWVKVLSGYREPATTRSAFELAVTLVPFILLWALAWAAMSVSYWLTFGLSLLNAGFLLRLFAIQHDCGHGAFFKSRTFSDWVGRVLGVLTVTPYDVWRHTHSVHHSSSGNLCRRGMGDIHTMTVHEYQELSWIMRLHYRLYRNPLVLFGLGPGYIFLLQNRIPLGLMDRAKYWISAMATNAAILAVLGLVIYFGGLAPILLIFLPSTLLAATAGVWLFYVQHQFEETHWDKSTDWDLHDAALHGSSHYVLPPVLQWLSANIGIHHVHHLYSRIPFYRLPDVLRDHPDLDVGNRMTIGESFANARLHLWDEDSRQLLSFAQVHALRG